MCSTLFSQEIPKFAPPSPTPYELGKYDEVPIGMFTGSPNLSIPLIEYKTDGLTIPITLAYNYGRFFHYIMEYHKNYNANHDVINFNYADELYKYVTSQEQSLLSWYVNYPISSQSNDWCHYPATLPYEGPLNSHNLNIKGKKIASISSNNPIYETINFEYNTTHPQVANYSLLTALI
nr:hypothetical protein [uncultured Flavobacterium sp.]